MAKQLPKWIKDELARSGWKAKVADKPLYTYVKDNFEVDIVPSLNHRYRVVITKTAKLSVANSMLIDSEQVVNLLRNPVIHY